jgi:hypothetical protein
MKDGTPRIQKYVLIPLPRTDARPRRFRLAPVDAITRLPTVMAGPERLRPPGLHHGL